MNFTVEAIYEKEVLGLTTPLNLPQGERESVTLTVMAEVKARRAARDAREIEIINRNIDALNAEALDVLEYQIS